MEERNDHPQGSEETLGELLDRCGHFFTHRIGGSRRGQGSILSVLAQRPGITQTELAQILGVQSASVSEVLMKLERKGFVKREKAEQDRRSIQVTLTEAGQEHLNRPEVDPSTAFQALSDAEQAELARLLQKLLQDWRQRYPERRGQHGDHGTRREETHGFSARES